MIRENGIILKMKVRNKRFSHYHRQIGKIRIQ